MPRARPLRQLVVTGLIQPRAMHSDCPPQKCYNKFLELELQVGLEQALQQVVENENFHQLVGRRLQDLVWAAELAMASVRS